MTYQLRRSFVLVFLAVSLIAATSIPAFTPPAFLTRWGSQGTSAGQFGRPHGVAVDSFGNVYVSDTDNDRIQKFSSTGTYLAEWGGTGTGDGKLDYPWGIAVDASGDILVADGLNHRIQKFASDGTFLGKWGKAGGGSGAGDGEFYWPYDVTVDAAGNIYVADTWNFRIQKFDSSFTFVDKFGSYGPADGQLIFASGLAVDSSGNVYVVDWDNSFGTGIHRLQKFDGSGTWVATWSSTQGSADGQFYYPYDVMVDKSDNVFVVDGANQRIQVFDTSGTFLGKWGQYGSADGDFQNPRGIAMDATGNIFIADTYHYQIQKFGFLMDFFRAEPELPNSH